MKRNANAGLLLLLLLIAVAYANHFNNSFHFDDFHTVTDNPAVRSLRNVPRFFTDAGTFSVLPANRTYRPMVSASLALDYALGHGYVPFWFHLSTFLFFLGLVALIYLLYRTLLDKIENSNANQWIALAGAAWFGLHPAMAETVNYVIQRGDLFCTLGCVAALVLFAHDPGRRKTGLYLLPLAFALLSKPPAAVFPVLLFLYVFFFEPEESSSRWKASALAALPSAVVTGVLLWVQSAMTPKTFLPSIISPWDYRLTQPYVWLRYVGALILPLHLNVDTDLAPFVSFNLRELAGLLFLAALAAAIWAATRRRITYPIAFGLLWFVVTQLPTSMYPLSEVENDHRMFFSFVGLILAAVWGAVLGIRAVTTPERQRALRPAIAAVALVVVCAYAYGTHRRNAVWHSEDTLWLDDAQKSPRNGRGLMIYGLTRMSKGDYPVALDAFERALAFTPNYPTLEVNLGVVNGAMADKGDSSRAAAAEGHFLRAIALAPGDDTTHAFYGRWLFEHARYSEAAAELEKAVALNPPRIFQHDLLIQTRLRQGDAAAARKAAQEALAIAPDDTIAAMATQGIGQPAAQNAASWINQSLAQYQAGDYPHSIQSAQRALELDPRMAEAYVNIGAAYGGLKQWDEAIRNEQQALRLKPGLPIAQNNLAWYEREKAAANQPHNPVSEKPVARSEADWMNESLALNQAGKFEQSIQAAQAVLRINPRSAVAWNNIAANNEAMHRWDAAIDAAQRALALQPDLQIAKNNLAWSLSQKSLSQKSLAQKKTGPH